MTPLGSPEALKVTGLLNPPDPTILTVPPAELPCCTEMEDGPLRVKLAGACTINGKLVVADKLPEVPVTVIG